ncbi:MAG TPA: ATP-grasp domain-containing protein, partial [Jatrophihabitans sp.]
PPDSVLVLEEPEIIRDRNLPEAQPHRCVARLQAVPIQAEADPQSLFEVARPPQVRAVIPANEYAVVAAARLAQRWGLPGAGVEAALALRDKARLRELADLHGIAQPAWGVAADPEAAVRLRGRGGCVVKPANRQASLGVTVIEPQDSDDLVRDAWHRAVRVPETGIRTSHVSPPAVLVEERLVGPEVSVESLVSRGAVVFENVTAKVVQPGRFPVESGHSVPAVLAPLTRQRLAAATRELIAALGFGDGILHAEWILVQERPHLIECAGRMPGDHIVDLINLAYGGDLTSDFLRVLEGVAPVRPQEPGQGAAIRFVSQQPGTVREVYGVPEVEAIDTVEEVQVVAQQGEQVVAPQSSWQRAGHVIVTGDTGAAAAAQAEDHANRIHIDTTP